jgi:hypothetical protein
MRYNFGQASGYGFQGEWLANLLEAVECNDMQNRSLL